ncbi:hypothetical protein [Nevskia ramosa]|nr:hypothetical protein [Nevskia ramosa]
MNRDEIRATAGLSVIYSLRMLGPSFMTMILPVFAADAGVAS